jgi:hypothetical protein
MPSVRAALRAALLVVPAALAAGIAQTAAGEQHGTHVENRRWGYRVRPPKDWKRRAIPLDEPWIADKFFPDHTLRVRDAVGGGMVEMTPELWVIGFPHARRERAGVRVEKPDENTTIITVENPYKDYLDFVKREEWASTQEGGWYVSRDEVTQVDGLSVRVYEIKVEKLVRAPMRIVTYVYPFFDVDLAVQVRILEEHYAANKNVIEGAVASLRQVPRTEPFPEEAKPRIPTKPGAAEDDPRTPEQIDAESVERIRARIAKELANLPPGWRAQTSEHFTCLTQLDKIHTQYVLNFAEEVRDYLEEHFARLGRARVPPGLIRVFTSSKDEEAYRQGTRGWWAVETDEVTLTYGRDASILFEFSQLAERLVDQYFHLKNENLAGGMPGWIRNGIWGHIGWARPSKRKKLVLAPTPGDVRDLAVLFAEGRQLPLRELMTADTSDFDVRHYAQARSVVHWLLGRGNRGKTKDALLRYLLSLDGIIREEDAKFLAETEERAKAEAQAEAERAAEDRNKTDAELEEEEDRRFRDRRQRWEAHSKEYEAKWSAIRARALDAAFGHLTDADWKDLDAAWRRFAQP